MTNARAGMHGQYRVRACAGWWLAAVALGGAGAADAAAQVEVRGQAEPLGTAVVKVDLRGVEVQSDGAGGGTKLVSWDRVRRIVGEKAGEGAAYADLADSVFRARTRLERGDLRGAEPLLERCYAKQTGLAGPTGAVLAEGVLRLRLARGAQAMAVAPWLDWLDLRYKAGTKEQQSWVGGRISLPEVIDPATGLVGRIPPVFSMVDNAAGVRLLSEASTWTRFEHADDAVRDIVAIYRAAASFEVNPGGGVAVPTIKTTEDHVVMMLEMVRARIGSPTERRDARGRLAIRLATVNLAASEDAATEAANPGSGAAPSGSIGAAWMEAWLRAAIGRSLLRESGPTEMRQGVVEMLHVPARLADAAPELARLALAEAADALARMGDDAASATLRDEMRKRFGPGAGDDGLITEEPAAPMEAEPLEPDEGAGG